MPTKVLIEDHCVWYQKRCRAHGVQKVLISDDLDYWRQQKLWLKPGDRPLAYQSRTEAGCPFDCGLCPDHEQHSCLAILDAVKARPIRHCMINTNGLRIARDREFAERLASYVPRLEVYLQFDSLRDGALMDLRGAKLAALHRQALEVLEELGLATTLVCVVKRGVNDGEVAEIVRHALEWSCVRGVTFQPVQDAGRNEGFDPAVNRVLPTQIRRAVADSGVFALEDMIPLPCNPDQICIGYGLRQGAQVTPITSLLPRELVLQGPNTISYEAYPELREGIVNLLSLATAQANTGEKLAAVLCCLPQAMVPEELNYANSFRVVILQFLDRWNFDLGTVKRSCVHFVTDAGTIIPFDTYNTFYCPGAEGAGVVARHRGLA